MDNVLSNDGDDNGVDKIQDNDKDGDGTVDDRNDEEEVVGDLTSTYLFGVIGKAPSVQPKGEGVVFVFSTDVYVVFRTSRVRVRLGEETPRDVGYGSPSLCLL